MGAKVNGEGRRLHDRLSISAGALVREEEITLNTLPVHCPLTYEKLTSYAFDPNAELLLALELIGQARASDN